MATYAADEAVDSDSRQVLFTYTFTRDTELAGYLKLRLWVEAQGSDDMDLFARVQKLSPHGQVLSVPTIPLLTFSRRKVSPRLPPGKRESWLPGTSPAPMVACASPGGPSMPSVQDLICPVTLLTTRSH